MAAALSCPGFRHDGSRMSNDDDTFAPKEARDAYWISRRRPHRTYVSKTNGVRQEPARLG